MMFTLVVVLAMLYWGEWNNAGPEGSVYSYRGSGYICVQLINSWIKYNQLPLFLKLKVPKEGMSCSTPLLHADLSLLALWLRDVTTYKKVDFLEIIQKVFDNPFVGKYIANFRESVDICVFSWFSFVVKSSHSMVRKQHWPALQFGILLDQRITFNNLAEGDNENGLG